MNHSFSKSFIYKEQIEKSNSLQQLRIVALSKVSGLINVIKLVALKRQESDNDDNFSSYA